MLGQDSSGRSYETTFHPNPPGHMPGARNLVQRPQKTRKTGPFGQASAGTPTAISSISHQFSGLTEQPKSESM